MMTDMELGWLAGVFEGEGCVTASWPHGHLQYQAKVEMSDEDIVRRFHQVIGVGTVRAKRSYPYEISKDGRPWKPMWTWVIGTQEGLLNFCALLQPMMGTRRAAKMAACISDLTGEQHGE